MSKNPLHDFLETHLANASLIEPGVPTPTVQDAARALGVQPQDIIKSVAFSTKASTGPTGTVLVIAPGDRRIDTNKVARLAGLKRVKMSTPDEVLAATGYPAGGVPPVGHPSGLCVLFEASLLEREFLIGGGGATHLLLKITPADVLRVTGALVGDVCQNP